MLRVLLSVFLCFAFLASDAQKLDSLRIKQADGWEFIQVMVGARLFAEGYNHNGRAEGVWTSFWENGYPMYISTFREGVLNGVKIQIDNGGFTTLLENYRDAKLDGPHRTFNRNSVGAVEEVYYSEGKKHGRFIKRYATGKVQEESNYNMDEKDGRSIWYYENGEKAADYSYRKGAMDGEVSIYNEAGQVTEAGVYKNNEQSGVWKEYHPNGKIKAEGQYVNGQKQGPWKEYNEAGKLQRTVKYNNGEPQ